MQCSNCDRAWPDEYKVCPTRARPLEKGTLAGKAERHLPKPVPSLEGERRLVTVMFANTSGFTAMSETMNPEALRDLMNACFEHLVPIIEK
jgi:class 3 adenylate cyclase